MEYTVAGKCSKSDTDICHAPLNHLNFNTAADMYKEKHEKVIVVKLILNNVIVL